MSTPTEPPLITGARIRCPVLAGARIRWLPAAAKVVPSSPLLGSGGPGPLHRHPLRAAMATAFPACWAWRGEDGSEAAAAAGGSASAVRAAARPRAGLRCRGRATPSRPLDPLPLPRIAPPGLRGRPPLPRCLAPRPPGLRCPRVGVLLREEMRKERGPPSFVTCLRGCFDLIVYLIRISPLQEGYEVHYQEMRHPQQIHGRLKSFTLHTTQEDLNIDISAITDIEQTWQPVDDKSQPYVQASEQPTLLCGEVRLLVSRIAQNLLFPHKSYTMLYEMAW
ncbi:hypothetical protein U9M48_008256 [Paspalum notatum var. saurae]